MSRLAFHRPARFHPPSLPEEKIALPSPPEAPRTSGGAGWISIVLPLLSSGFVPTGSMPPGLRQFAEYQPYTPVTQTVRGLLTHAAIGDHAIAAIAWSVGLAVVAYLWATRLYNRRRAAEPK